MNRSDSVGVHPLVVAFLERLGSPEAIAAEAGAVPRPSSSAREVAAIILRLGR